MRVFLRLLGIVLIAFGLLFVLQGAGVVHWPRESFMLDQRPWVWRGALVALAGLAALLTARRI